MLLPNEVLSVQIVCPLGNWKNKAYKLDQPHVLFGTKE